MKPGGIVAAIVAALSLAACGGEQIGPETRLVPEGRWAGGDPADPLNFYILTTTSSGAQFADNAACTFGSIDQPLRTDRDGRFSVEARLMRIVPTPQRTRLDGLWNGNLLRIRFTLDGRAREYNLLFNAPIPVPRFVC